MRYLSTLSTNHCLPQLESWSHSFWLCVGGVIDDNLPIPSTPFNRNSLDFNDWSWSWSNCPWSIYLSNAFNFYLPDRFISLSIMPWLNWSIIDPLLIEKVPKRWGSKPTTGHTVCSSARNSLSGVLEKDASTNNLTVIRNMTGIWMFHLYIGLQTELLKSG